MSKFIGFIVGAALVVVGIVTGNPYLIIQGGAMIVSNAVLLLTAPKQPARQASEMSIQLGEQPRCMMIGEAFTAGSLVDGFNYGGKYGTDWEVLVIRLADHKCEGLTGFYVNDEYVVYTGNGNYPQFDGSHFELYFRADTTAEALPAVVTANGPGWLATDVGESGCDVTVCYRSDPPDAKEPAWPGGRPRFGFVLKGKLCYDPRLDDTVTGGAGAHRWAIPSTWEWSENPVVCRYNWARGVYANDDTADQTALLVGRGLSEDEAPPENIIAAANLCGEAVLIGGALPFSQSDAEIGASALYSISPNGQHMIRWTSGDIEFWSLPARVKIGVVTAGFPGSGSHTNVAVDDFGNAWAVGPGGTPTLERQWFFSLASAETNTAIPGAPTDATSGPTRVFTVDAAPRLFAAVRTGIVDGLVYTASSDAARDFCLDANGNIWAVTQTTGSSDEFSITRLTGGAASHSFTATARSGPSSAQICHTPFGHFMVVMDGNYYLIDDVAFTLTTSGVAPWGSVDLPWAWPAETSFWAGEDEYSTEDGSLIRSIDPSDWLAEDTGATGLFYDRTNDALISMPNADQDHLTWRFLREPVRYRVAGPIYSNQDFIDVEGMFAAAVGGTVVTRGGSVELEPGAAKSVVATITDDDLLSGTKVNWNQGFLSEADQEWLNTVVPTYIEPDQKWNSHNAPPLRDTADILADGKPREAQLTLRLVRDLEQAQRVGEFARRLGRLWGRATVVLGPRWCELEDGDWINWQSDRYFGGATKTFRIDAYQIDAKWRNTLTLRQIHSSVYTDGLTFDPDLSEVPPPIVLPDVGTPDAGNWTLTATTLDSETTSVPALVVEGAADDDDYVETIIVEIWLDDGVGDPVADPDSVAWTMVGSYPPTTTRVEITGLTGGATYYVAITYVVGGEYGDRLVLGPATVADYGTPYIELEDGFTPLHLEDDATLLSTE